MSLRRDCAHTNHDPIVRRVGKAARGGTGASSAPAAAARGVGVAVRGTPVQVAKNVRLRPAVIPSRNFLR